MDKKYIYSMKAYSHAVKTDVYHLRYQLDFKCLRVHKYTKIPLYLKIIAIQSAQIISNIKNNIRRKM